MADQLKQRQIRLMVSVCIGRRKIDIGLSGQFLCPPGGSTTLCGSAGGFITKVRKHEKEKKISCFPAGCFRD
jgi:hypothetical protein